jgi:hypothetical protein
LWLIIRRSSGCFDSNINDDLILRLWLRLWLRLRLRLKVSAIVVSMVVRIWVKRISVPKSDKV